MVACNGQDQGRCVGPIERALEVEFRQPDVGKHRLRYPVSVT